MVPEIPIDLRRTRSKRNAILKIMLFNLELGNERFEVSDIIMIILNLKQLTEGETVFITTPQKALI